MIFETQRNNGVSERKMRNRNRHGFTLIELMIAVAIVGILAAIAYPSYQNSVTKSRRAEGKSLLLDAAAREERFFAQYNQYTTTIVAPSGCAGSVCGLNYSSSNSTNGYYTLTTPAATNPSTAVFGLTATPQGAQATGDPSCATFTLNNLGVKGATGTNTSVCW